MPCKGPLGGGPRSALAIVAPPSQPRRAPRRARARTPALLSFDHLVGAGEEGGRDRQLERASGPQVNEEFEPCRLLNRKVARSRPLYNAIDVEGGPMPHPGEISSVRN